MTKTNRNAVIDQNNMTNIEENLPKLDELELYRYLGSIEYTIPTKSIMKLMQKVEDWITMNNCGAIIYGESRTGKTRAIRYISIHLQCTYGKELPIYNLNCTAHVPTQKTFYASILTSIGHEEPHKGTAVQMRQRLINRIITNAMDTKYRRAVLFVDEAYLMDEKEYLWLIDIYNELNNNDILLTVFLFGTRELKALKTGFIRSEKKQIVHRFMVDEFEFKGITCERDAAICLSSIDKPIHLPSLDEGIVLSEMYFPNAYSEGRKLHTFAPELWQAFESINARNNIHTDQVLMKYFMDTVFICMRKYGVFAEGLYAPGKEEWEQSIIASGYVLSQI